MAVLRLVLFTSSDIDPIQQILKRLGTEQTSTKSIQRLVENTKTPLSDIPYTGIWWINQLCMAHLLRELTNFVENIRSEWSARTKELLQRAIELKGKMTEDHYLHPPEEVIQLNAELDKLPKTDYSKFHRKEQAFIKRLNKHRQSIFTFLLS